MATKLFLVRHGQSEGNFKQVVQGRSEYGLTTKGKQQALDVAHFLAEEGFDVVYSSPQQRAFETASIIANQKHLPVNVSRDLVERDYGKYEGIGWNEVSPQHADRFEYFYSENNPALEQAGVETISQVRNRGLAAIKQIVHENNEKKIVVVTHGGLLRCIAMTLFGISHAELKNFRVTNCGVSRIDFLDGEPRAVFLNEQKHLQA
ncbi:MAG TPA: histidine phosphatase family protein [Candidatus Norongarragalinales archaeon]|jgi:broad specificity phosphatase PhoE|nr:histidine phosphatase family protein [Candidatus Norongarragalinales archaeon]